MHQYSNWPQIFLLSREQAHYLKIPNYSRFLDHLIRKKSKMFHSHMTDNHRSGLKIMYLFTICALIPHRFRLRNLKISPAPCRGLARFLQDISQSFRCVSNETLSTSGVESKPAAPMMISQTIGRCLYFQCATAFDVAGTSWAQPRC